MYTYNCTCTVHVYTCMSFNYIFKIFIAQTLSVLKVASLQPGAILNDAYKEYKVFNYI